MMATLSTSAMIPAAAHAKRLPQLEGLRGIAILLVFVYHVVNVPLWWSGVDLFFVLSGFFITGVLLGLKEKYGAEGHGECWRRFYARRARRILPPFLLLILVASLVFDIEWRGVWYYYAFFNANLANVLDVVPARALVPMWSLAIEEQFYFVWPFVVFFCSPKVVRNVAIGLIIGAPVLRMVFTPFTADYQPIYNLAPFRVDALACGAFVAVSQYRDREWIKQNGTPAARWALTAALLLGGLSISPGFRMSAHTILFNTLGYSLIAVMYAGVLVYAVAKPEGPVYAFLSNKFLRYVGLISYTFYLFHDGVIRIVAEQIYSRPLVGLISFVVSGAIAFVSWWVMEAPLMGLPRTLQKSGAD